jgi:anaerobic selenocysteine-containing dehydrogenase
VALPSPNLWALAKGSVKLEDLYEAEVIIILGQNPGTNHPRMLTALQKAKANGAIIISINPLPETGLMGFNNPQQLKGMLGIGTTLTDIFLQVKIGADMALLQAIEILLLEEEQKTPGSVFDQNFIEKSTTGYQQFIEHLKTLNLDDLIQHTGIDKTQIAEAANILKTKNKIIACWAMGLTQHKNAVDTIKEVVNLLLLKGSIGKKGAGTCPVRGHSNVQGDRTMGIYEKPSQSFLNALEKNFGFTPATTSRLRYRRKHQSHAHRQGQNIFCVGGQFSFRHPRYFVHRRSLAQLQAHCACVYQIKSQPPGAWRRSNHTSLPCPQR